MLKDYMEREVPDFHSFQGPGYMNGVILGPPALAGPLDGCSSISELRWAQKKNCPVNPINCAK